MLKQKQLHFPLSAAVSSDQLHLIDSSVSSTQTDYEQINVVYIDIYNSGLSNDKALNKQT